MMGSSWETRLTKAAGYRTACRCLPYVLTHLFVKPFRAATAAQSIDARLTNPEYRRSVHDIYCAMFLDGYEESTSLPVSSGTGLAVVLFTCFIYTFDQEFEKRWKSTDPPDYMDIISTPAVAEIWEALAEYLRASGRAEVLTHLLNTFSAYYDNYCQCMTLAMSGGFDATFRLVQYDSGRSLLALYDVIRLFNGHELHQGCANEFFAIGMAGKFFDDLRDMAEDVEGGSPNLLHALTTEHPDEKQVLTDALRNDTQFTLGWWSAHCPVSLISYFRYAFRYYDQVHSPKLRLPLDLCLALLGSRLYWRRPIHRSPADRQ